MFSRMAAGLILKPYVKQIWEKVELRIGVFLKIW
jgi:hypothetical protein